MESINNGITFKLKDPDLEVRLSALKSLAGLHDPQSVDWVIDALGDSEWRIRKAAVAIAVSLKDADHLIDQLIARLGGEKNVGMQNSAVEVFIQLGKVSVGRLLNHLPRANEDIGKFIIDTLGEIKDPKSVPSLIERLSGANENVQASAIEALGKIRDAAAVLPLLEILKRDQSLSKFSAIKALGQIGDTRAVAPLIEILAQSMFKRTALEALAAIGDIRALAPLSSAFSSGSTSIKHAALKAIAMLESKQLPSNGPKIKETVRAVYSEEIYLELMEILERSDKQLKSAAIKMLGWLNETKSISTLVPLLNSEYEDVADGALVAMGQKAITPIVSVLSEQNEKIREKVALILGKSRDRQAVPTLLELLNDRNGHVRSTSARALGLIGDPSTIKFLFKVLADPYPDVQESAERALMEMKEELPVGSIIELLKSDSSALRCHAALLLGEIKSDETISPLSFLLKDPDENVRKSAVHALGFFDSEKIIQHLTVAFGDEDHRVRLAALKILEHISLEEIEKILDDLVPLFHDENIWVRSEIPRILGRIPGERVFKLLLELLNDGVGAVKISALSVLGNRKEEEALPFLLAQTSHPDIEVKKAAILALGVFGNPSVRVVLHSFLTDPHWAIRASAARAIGNLRNPDSLFELNEMTVSDADPLVREAARIALAQIRGMG